MESDHAASDIAAFLRGEPEIVAEVRASIRGVVRGFQFRRRDAERDLVQEAVSRVVQNLSGGRFRGESSLRTYAQQVAKYVCLEHIRRQRAEVPVDFEAIPSEARWSEPEEALLREEEHARNLQAFEALPAESRELLTLLFVEGLTYGEAGRRLGLSETAIKSRVHRLRAECREVLARLPGASRKIPGVER